MNESITDNRNGHYAWFIIALGAMTNLVGVGIPLMCMPVFFKAISQDLNLSLVQIGVAWGMGGLASVITNPFGGLISDRFGIKRVLTIACLLAGCAGASRGLASNYITLILSVFAVGFVQNTIVLTIHKSTGIWFSGRKVVLANGCVSTGIALGMLLGAMISDTLMAPLLGGWRHVLFFYGGVTFCMGILWALSRQEPLQKSVSDGNIQSGFGQSVRRVLRTRTVWTFGWVHFCIIGSILGVIGYLPLYLRSMGWTPAAADGALASLNAAGMLGAIPLSIISSRLGLRKGILVPTVAVAMICAALLPFVDGAFIWPLVMLFGFMRDGYFAILMTMVIESKGIGPAYAGTAMGIIFSIGNIGVFFAAPFGNRLATINPDYAFLFWAAMLFMALIAFHFSKESGEPA